VPWHEVWPEGQLAAWQLPATHDVPLLHATPQPPQFCASFARSTQIPLHEPQPAGQVQTPLTHAPLPQLDPQAPQLERSVSRFTQVAELE
jgi:hypothetical protein